MWRDILLWKFFKIYIQTSIFWKLVSLGIMERYFLSKKILKILPSDRQLSYFRVLVIYGEKNSLCTPNFWIFVSLVKREELFARI